MISNSECFLDYFNKIDQHLNKLDGHTSFVSYSRKINETMNGTVKRFKEELLSLGKLRNAIVHHPRIGGKVIAEPHEETVNRIKELYQKIRNPKRVFPEFEFEVLGAKKNDFINNILIKMRQYSFSQFPIFNYDNRVIELINTNTISRWFSLQLEDTETIIIEKVQVKDLISAIEFKHNYRFVSKNTTVYEAYDLFINQIETEERNLDVLFITPTGNKTEEPLGLITIEDIATKVQIISGYN